MLVLVIKYFSIFFESTIPFCFYGILNNTSGKDEAYLFTIDLTEPSRIFMTTIHQRVLQIFDRIFFFKKRLFLHVRKEDRRLGRVQC